MDMRRILKLYPTTDRLLEERRTLFTKADNKASFTGNLMTVASFEKRLADELLFPLPEITDFTRALLLASIAWESRLKFIDSPLIGISRYKGFTPALLRFFDELGAGLVTPKMLEKIDGYSHAKEKTISRLYKIFRERIKKSGFTDHGMLLQEVSEKLSSAESFDIPLFHDFKKIEFYDIHHFTPYRFELIRLIAKVIPVTIVAPVPDNRRKAFGFITRNLAKFESLAGDEGYLDIRFTEEEDYPLKPLAETVFDIGRRPMLSDDQREELKNRVEIIRCASRYREIEEIGERIIMLRNDGVDTGQIILVARDIKKYGAIIEDVFRRYHIPLSMRQGLTLSSAEPVRAVYALFSAIDTGFLRDKIVAVISSPWFALFDEIDILVLHDFLSLCSIHGGEGVEWNSKVSEGMAKISKGHYNGDKRKKLRKTGELITGLIDKLHDLSKADRGDVFFGRLFDLLRWLKFSHAKPVEDEYPENIIKNRSAYDHFGELLVLAQSGMSAEGDDPGAAIGYTALKDLLFGVIENSPMAEYEKADRNCVSAMNVIDAIGIRRDVVFLCGLHEKEFPLYKERRSVLGEKEREEFDKIFADTFFKENKNLRPGRKVFDSAYDKWQEESLFFYQAILCARERLFVSYSEKELSGRALLRSQFVDDILDLLALENSKEEREELITSSRALCIEKGADRLFGDEELLAKTLHDLFKPAESSLPVFPEQSIAKIMAIPSLRDRFYLLAEKSMIERRRDRLFMIADDKHKKEISGSYDGVIENGDSIIPAIVEKEAKSVYSPTALEKFGQCPYRYFADKILKLDKIDEITLELDARNKGSLAHLVLEKFYEKIIGDKIPKPDSVSALLEPAISAAVKEYAEQNSLGDPALFEVEKEALRKELGGWIKKDVAQMILEGYEPVALEQKFDFKERCRGDVVPEEPLSISTANGVRYFGGSPDRIDICRKDSVVRVVDYKRSASDAKYRDMLKAGSLGVTSFQMPIYMLLAGRFVRDKKLLSSVSTRVGAYGLLKRGKDPKNKYMITTESIRKGKVDEAAFLGDGEGSEFFDRAREMIGQIESGRFTITPKDCEFCNMYALCRIADSPSAVEKE